MWQAKLLANCSAIFLLAAFAVLNATPPARAQSLTQKLKQEARTELIAAIKADGDAARGAVLFAEQKLACASCHGAGRQDLLGPDLGQLGASASEEVLLDALLEPSKTIRKGFETVVVLTEAGRVLTGRVVEETGDELTLRDNSALRKIWRIAKAEIEQTKTQTVSGMPDNLVDQLENRKQFLDLMHYVFEVVAAGPQEVAAQTQSGGQVAERLQGLVLLNELNCAQCHQYEVPETGLTVAKAPNLGKLSGAINPNYLREFLSDPHATKPGTRMPDVLHRLPEASKESAVNALTHFIVSNADKKFATSPVSSDAASRGQELFHSVGCVACHSPRNEAGHETLPEDSVHLGKIDGKYNLGSLVAFLKNPHELRPAGRMPDMKLTHWEAIEVASYLLSPQHSAPVNAPEFRLDRELVAQGQKQFRALGCVRCHTEVDKSHEQSDLPPLLVALDDADLESGCLSGGDSDNVSVSDNGSANEGGWPRYSLSRSERQAIRVAIGWTDGSADDRTESRGPIELSGEERIAVHLTAFRCTNCHIRAELGGVTDARNPHFQTTNPNLGPQGRIPPTLTGVGAKLKPTWMRQVLAGGRSIRPYLKTRMPLYGADNVVQLVDLFQRVDKQEPAVEVKFADKKEMRKAGLELAGTSGLNCIVCHTFQSKPAATMPAVDLTDMAERLHKDWFHRYMRYPQQLSPNTVMPSFWPGGKAIRGNVLGGDSGQQIEALWQYLLDGRQARAPRGVIREPMELVANAEAIMLRRSYPGIGKRGIGVGYPSQVNLAFDAEQMRVAMIWKGKFADPGGVWRSQGHGMVRPLGERPIEFAKGVDIDDLDQPWTADEDRPSIHQFKGYTLDENRRPTFQYQIGNATVEDFTVDLVDPESRQPFFRRTLTIRTQQQSRRLVFRAADGNEIVDVANGAFLVDGKLRVRVAEPHMAEIQSSESGQQIRIPLEFRDGVCVVTLDYVW